jgi:hypothetical protein
VRPPWSSSSAPRCRAFPSCTDGQRRSQSPWWSQRPSSRSRSLPRPAELVAGLAAGRGLRPLQLSRPTEPAAEVPLALAPAACDRRQARACDRLASDEMNRVFSMGVSWVSDVLETTPICFVDETFLFSLLLISCKRCDTPFNVHETPMKPH